MKIELQAITQPVVDTLTSENFTAYVARIGKIKENPEKLLKYLIKHKHWSPFEHTYITFKIRTSRAIGRELLRHRSFTFQELSQRYEEMLEFEPIELRKQSEKNRQSSTEIFDPSLTALDYKSHLASSYIKRHLNLTLDLYDKLLKVGVARECARMILPEATSTTILMTGNLRSWIHFLEVRDDGHAQKEAQEVAKAIKEVLLNNFPIVFKSIEDVKKTSNNPGV